MNTTTSNKHLSFLAAWALAFGCAVGSDAFVLPWTTFLPKAGPVGSMLGIVIGSLAMAIIAWNYHYMINRKPGPGGVYTYASEVFGHDHGFLCGYFLGFAYVAIVWLDVTAFVGVVEYSFGDVFHFGFHYNMEGREIFLGHILCALTAIAAMTAICCRRRLSGGVQTVMALLFAAGILIFFVAAIFRHEGGMETMRPAFSMTGGSLSSQIQNILIIALWLFVGFESISNSSAEFRFPLGKSFKVMLAALVTAVVAYLLLTALPVLVSGSVDGGWSRAVATIGASPNFHAFDATSGLLGRAGKVLIGLTLMGGIVTNLVGNTVAASRIAATMANDGAFPAWIGERNADGSPRNAVLTIAGLAVLVIPLGSAVIGIIVDIAIVGAAIAYGYTSAAAFKMARAARDRRTQATGLLGTAISIATFAVFLQPMFTLAPTEISTESYLVLIAWGLSGLAIFLTVFHRDALRRFGNSSVVWTSLFVMIFILSWLWIHQTTRDTTRKAYDAIISYHARNCLRHGTDVDADVPETPHAHGTGDWRASLRRNLAIANSMFIRNSLVQGGLNLLALAMMFALFRILRRREREMELEKAKAKSYFFSTVSHDIRTPLNAIIGYSTMLASGFKTEDERKEAIDSILMSGKTLLGLVNDVLDLSKLESGKMEIVPEPTDCPRLLHGVIDAFRVSGGGKPGLKLRCCVGEMPALMLDPQRLRQIVFNLVGNAVKFTKEGHVELRARFDRRGGEDAGVFRLDVEDTGCGISEEDQKRLGSAYVQVGAKVSRNGGTGLGLAICRQLAVAMGGSLEVESEIGRGSTFSITIPDVRVAETDGTGATSGTRETGNKQVVSSVPSVPVHRILLVDDSKMNLMILKALLKNMGDFEIVMASDGQEALKTLEVPDTKPFDLVLTDMWMPNLDGEGLVRAIRANPALSSLRVVAVTADVESQGTFIAMGFDDLLLKPVTVDKLGKILAGDGPT